MLFPSSKTDQYIVTELSQNKASKGTDIVDALVRISPKLTKQAIYASLRRLIKKEIIVKNNGYFVLNKAWLKNLKDFTLKNEVSMRTLLPNIQMQEGDRMSFKFKDAFSTDIYWGHLFASLYEQQDPDQPVIIYNPHEWFIHARPDSESQFLKQFNVDKKTLWLAIGGKTSMDKKFRTEWTSWKIQINTGKNYGFENTYYMNIFGDVLIEVTVTPVFAKGVEKFYTEDVDIFSLKSIVAKSYQTKLVISVNKKKAEKIRKKLARDFK